ncbi:2-oxo-4-hydroxy-4-carboxy-5-ureidoimidazoline decarboxylase [Gluconobacter cerinus]|uniref:2-oxo-4-hydroxy-4-carboxy-5-ureidoimidazoline decarboxylase n=1 Tax=Gluconobacter cerinus TaxID=38307 RepID=UPI00193F2729|nr:2-oxo-4-hydroxy-4-carboxy-5-ureidoimidazoline decarboxylase [Gluconobacter cerinus]MBM3097418.1 2-oxo-4-hydroxy-4-carboxy-5-ureidoimidazoline decarboxylase [Gluconobacter cerinus]
MKTSDVNAMTSDVFVQTFGGLYEHSPWVAEGALAARPFAGVEAMLAAFSDVVRNAGEEAQLALVRAHPELGHRAGIDPDLTAESASEQASAGLDRLTPAEYERFKTLNAAYGTAFSMPFVICVRKVAAPGQVAKTVIMDEMERRLGGAPEAELKEALSQIDAIAGLRLKDLVTS